MTTVKRSPEAFEHVWEAIIEREIRDLCKEDAVFCDSLTMAKRHIQRAYNHFNKQCSELYMADPGKPLNQRKIAACYAQAIVMERPLRIDYLDDRCTEPPLVGERLAYESRPCFANERLAIHTACSVLVSFLRKAIRDDRCVLTVAQRDQAELCLNKGVYLLQDLDGGEFLLNLERTLSLMSLDDNYNTPLLACLFSYWESCILPRDIYRKVLTVFAMESELSHEGE